MDFQTSVTVIFEGVNVVPNEGYITSYRYYAKNLNHVELSIWRQTVDSYRYSIN